MDVADFSLSERQALQMDKAVVPPGGDRVLDPGPWSYLRRLACHHGVATIDGLESEVTVTLPIAMPSASFTVIATIQGGAGLVGAFGNSPVHLVAVIDSASSITLSLVSGGGGAVEVPDGESLNIFWAVRE